MRFSRCAFHVAFFALRSSRWALRAAFFALHTLRYTLRAGFFTLYPFRTSFFTHWTRYAILVVDMGIPMFRAALL